MSIGIEAPHQSGTQGTMIVLTVKGTALRDVPLDVWFDNRTDLKKSTRSNPTNGSFSVDLVIPQPANGNHTVTVQDTSTNGKTLTKDVRFPLTPLPNGGGNGPT